MQKNVKSSPRIKEIDIVIKEGSVSLHEVELYRKDIFLLVCLDIFFTFTIDAFCCMLANEMIMMWLDIGVCCVLTFPIILYVFVLGKISVLKIGFFGAALAGMIQASVCLSRLVFVIFGGHFFVFSTLGSMITAGFRAVFCLFLCIYLMPIIQAASFYSTASSSLAILKKPFEPHSL